MRPEPAATAHHDQIAARFLGVTQDGCRRIALCEERRCGEVAGLRDRRLRDLCRRGVQCVAVRARGIGDEHVQLSLRRARKAKRLVERCPRLVSAVERNDDVVISIAVICHGASIARVRPARIREIVTDASRVFRRDRAGDADASGRRWREAWPMQHPYDRHGHVIPSLRTRRLVAGIEAIVGLGALYGGFELLHDAEGFGVKRAWLAGSVFPDYTIPGLVLAVVVGGGMFVAAALTLVGGRHTATAALAMGLVLLCWGIVETVTLGPVGGAQIALLSAFVVAPGVALTLFGARVFRTSAGDLIADADAV